MVFFAMTIQWAPLQDEVSLDGRERLWRMLQLRRRVRAITLSPPPPPRGGAEARPETDEAAAADGVVEVEADEQKV